MQSTYHFIDTIQQNFPYTFSKVLYNVQGEEKIPQNLLSNLDKRLYCGRWLVINLALLPLKIPCELISKTLACAICTTKVVVRTFQLFDCTAHSKALWKKEVRLLTDLLASAIISPVCPIFRIARLLSGILVPQSYFISKTAHSQTSLLHHEATMLDRKFTQIGPLEDSEGGEPEDPRLQDITHWIYSVLQDRDDKDKKGALIDLIILSSLFSYYQRYELLPNPDRTEGTRMMMKLMHPIPSLMSTHQTRIFTGQDYDPEVLYQLELSDSLENKALLLERFKNCLESRLAILHSLEAEKEREREIPYSLLDLTRDFKTPDQIKLLEIFVTKPYAPEKISRHSSIVRRCSSNSFYSESIPHLSPPIDSFALRRLINQAIRERLNAIQSNLLPFGQ